MACDAVVEVRGEPGRLDRVGDRRLDRGPQRRERGLGLDRSARQPPADLVLHLVLRERRRGAVGERPLVEHHRATVEGERAEDEQGDPTREQTGACFPHHDHST